MRVTGAESVSRQALREDVLALIRSRAAAARPASAGAAPDGAPQVAAGDGATGAATQTDQAIEQINTKLKVLGTSLHFEVDKDSGLTIVSVVDRDTNEVLRQIPTEETVQIARNLDKVIGHLLDRTI